MASAFSHFIVMVILALTQSQTLTAEEKNLMENTKNLKPSSVIKPDNLKSWTKRSVNTGKALNAIRQAMARDGNPLDNHNERYWNLLEVWLRDNGYPLTAANAWGRRAAGLKSRVTRNQKESPDKKNRQDTWDSVNSWGKRSPKSWSKRGGDNLFSMTTPSKRNADTWDSMSAWGKRNGDTWDSMSAWGKRNADTWDSMSAWGKRNPDTWDSMSAWGKRNPDTWDSMSAWGKRGADTWDSMSAWGKRNPDTWDSMSAWGKRDGDTWDSMSAWGKRNGDSGEKRDWDSLQAWGKRDGNAKNKKDWDSLAAWGKRNIAAGDGDEEIGSQVQDIMTRSSGKTSKSTR